MYLRLVGAAKNLRDNRSLAHAIRVAGAGRTVVITGAAFNGTVIVRGPAVLMMVAVISLAMLSRTVIRHHGTPRRDGRA